MLFAPIDAQRVAADGGRVWLVADDTGLPGVEGILTSLAGTVDLGCVLEVPHDDDRRELPGSPEVRWQIRGDGHALPGRARSLRPRRYHSVAPTTSTRSASPR